MTISIADLKFFQSERMTDNSDGAPAENAAQVAIAKQQEATELAKVVEAQKAYLESIAGGTQAQQQELQILQLKLVALQSEADEAVTAASAKKLAAQKVVEGQLEQANAQKALNRALEDGGETADGYAKTQEGLAKHTSDSSDALQGLSNYLGTTRKAMDGLSESTRLLFEAELASALERAHGITTTVGLATKAWRA